MNMLQVYCKVPQTRCNMLQVYCKVPQTRCNMLQVYCKVPQTRCNVLQVYCKVQQTRCNVLQVSCNDMSHKRHVPHEATSAVLDAMTLVHDDILPEVRVQMDAVVHCDLKRRDHDRLNFDPVSDLVPVVDLSP